MKNKNSVISGLLLGAGVVSYNLWKRTYQQRLRKMRPVAKQLYQLLHEYDMNRLEQLYLITKDHDIKTLQYLRAQQVFTYEELTAMYLYRILQYEVDISHLPLIHAINPEVLKEAKELDREYNELKSPVYGMPIILRGCSMKQQGQSQDKPKLNRLPHALSFQEVEEMKQQGLLILGDTYAERVNKAFLSKQLDVLESMYRKYSGRNLRSYQPSALVVTHNMAASSISFNGRKKITPNKIEEPIVKFKPTEADQKHGKKRGVHGKNNVVHLIGRSVLDVMLLRASMNQEHQRIPQPLHDLAHQQVGLIVTQAADLTVLRRVRTYLEEYGAVVQKIVVTDGKVLDVETNDFDLFIYLDGRLIHRKQTIGAPELTIPVGRNHFNEVDSITLLAAKGQDEYLLICGERLSRDLLKRSAPSLS